jgi:hypothetical protein
MAQPCIERPQAKDPSNVLFLPDQNWGSSILPEQTMCDELTERDNDDYLGKRGKTRRDFNKHGMGAALAMLLLPVTA